MGGWGVRREYLVPRFDTADGYIRLLCGHWGSHDDCVDDQRIYTDEEEDQLLDPRPWSYHIHLGLIGMDARPLMPEWWGTGDTTWQYCAMGATPQEAICRAILKAYRFE